MAAAEAKTTDAVLFQPKSLGEAQAETVATMLEIRPCADLCQRLLPHLPSAARSVAAGGPQIGAVCRAQPLRRPTPLGQRRRAWVNRYFHTPMKRYHGLRIAAQALDFVASRRLEQFRIRWSPSG